MSAAVRAELNDRMLSATSKVQIAEQTIEPIRQSLVQRGQTLNTDTQASMAQMRARLARAKTDIAAGDVDAARDDLASAEAYAARVMRVAGR
jgi:spermidine/putrescine-binding protein